MRGQITPPPPLPPAIGSAGRCGAGAVCEAPSSPAAADVSAAGASGLTRRRVQGWVPPRRAPGGNEGARKFGTTRRRDPDRAGAPASLPAVCGPAVPCSAGAGRSQAEATAWPHPLQARGSPRARQPSRHRPRKAACMRRRRRHAARPSRVAGASGLAMRPCVCMRFSAQAARSRARRGRLSSPLRQGASAVMRGRQGAEPRQGPRESVPHPRFALPSPCADQSAAHWRGGRAPPPGAGRRSAPRDPTISSISRISFAARRAPTRGAGRTACPGGGAARGGRSWPAAASSRRGPSARAAPRTRAS